MVKMFAVTVCRKVFCLDGAGVAEATEVPVFLASLRPLLRSDVSTVVDGDSGLDHAGFLTIPESLTSFCFLSSSGRHRLRSMVL